VADQHASVLVLSLQGELLSVAEVQRLSAILVRERGSRPALIDCASLERVSAAGLLALLELGHSMPGALALARLSRTMTRVAVEARLALHFAIYADRAPFERAHTPPEQQP
jgi:anti-anti-sigma regulatory factor